MVLQWKQMNQSKHMYLKTEIGVPTVSIVKTVQTHKHKCLKKEAGTAICGSQVFATDQTTLYVSFDKKNCLFFYSRRCQNSKFSERHVEDFSSSSSKGSNL